MDEIKIDDVCMIFAWRSGLVGLRDGSLQRAWFTVLGIQSGDDPRTVFSKKWIIAPYLYLYMFLAVFGNKADGGHYIAAQGSPRSQYSTVSYLVFLKISLRYRLLEWLMRT